MNKIRVHFAAEVEALLPLLHDTYRLVGRYQKDRNERHRAPVLAQLDLVGEHLQFFKPLVPSAKRPYFDAILNHTLALSDRIVALDIAVGAMHIEFSVERAYLHAESEALRRVLILSREDSGDKVDVSGEPDDGVLVRGLGASPGEASGKAAFVQRPSDYRRLPAGSVVVARMTRPELIQAVESAVAIVTDIGGSLCHAAIIARELGIPCVVGTQRATQVIHRGQLVSVNGGDGTVRVAHRLSKSEG
ncbi:MAG: hypothetical protein JXA74_14355 [Anaerolineae bacterium]|nr:hypothetical protein [Anaerolineae bacterium]